MSAACALAGSIARSAMAAAEARSRRLKIALEETWVRVTNFPFVAERSVDRERKWAEGVNAG